MIRVAFLASLLLLGAFLPDQTSAAVLGIDFGAQNYKISMIKPGKFLKMVENLYSKTMTYNGATFFDSNRFFEYDAATKASRNTKNAFIFLPKYFGKDPANAELQALIKSQHENTVLDTSRAESGTFFALDNFVLPKKGASAEDRPERLGDKHTVLRLEEIVGMVLQHAKFLCDKAGQTQFNDAFFTVPPWWTVVEREILYSAAKLAGFNPIGFMSENTGAAVFKGLERKEAEGDSTVLFYNMGAQSTKASLIKFSKKENAATKKMEERIQVLGETWDETLGGYGMDWCVAELFAKAFDAKHGTTVIENPKVMRRVLKTANKVKEMLSANKEAMMIVEQVFDDQDFMLKVTREAFEKECAGLFDRVKKPVEQLLETTGVAPSDIEFVEILGGASRVPKVKALLEEAAGKPTSMHMNGDDSMAMGASYAAANHTSNFKTKPIHLEHGPNYEVNVKITDPNDESFSKETNLFPRNHQYGSRKKVNLKHASDLRIQLTVPREGVEDYYTNYEVAGAKKILEDPKNAEVQNPRLSLGFSLDYMGVPFIHKAELLYEKEVVVEKKKKADKKKKEEGSGSESAEEQKDKEEDKEEEKEEEKPETKTQTVTRKLDIRHKESNGSSFLMDSDAIAESTRVLKAFKDYETYTRKISEAKNRLEGLVYKVEDLLEEEGFTQYATEAELEAIKAKAAENDEWLFGDDAAEADHNDFNDRYSAFFKVIRVVETRKENDARRPEVLSEAHTKIDAVETTIEEMQKSRPWISDEQIKEALDELKTNREWLEDKVVEQSKKPKSEEPVLSLADIRARAKNTQEIVYRLRKIRKPKKSKKEGAEPEAQAEGDFKLDPETLEKLKKQMEEKNEKDAEMKALFEKMMAEEKAKKEAEAQAGEAAAGEDAEAKKKGEGIDL